MISRKYRCIFVHQRKSAGTSIKALFDDSDWSVRDQHLLNDGILEAEWTSPEFKDYFKFTVIRNPYDRFISGWKYCRSTRNRSIKDTLLHLPKEQPLHNVLDRHSSWRTRGSYMNEYLHRRKDLLAFGVKKLLRSGSASLRPPSNEGHDYRHLTRCQHETIYWSSGELAIDRIFYFENFDEEVAELSRILGLKNTSAPKINVRRSSDDYRTYFDSETLELFRLKFAKELEYFDYDFETGQRRSKPLVKAI